MLVVVIIVARCHSAQRTHPATAWRHRKLADELLSLSAASSASLGHDIHAHGSPALARRWHWIIVERPDVIQNPSRPPSIPSRTPKTAVPACLHLRRPVCSALPRRALLTASQKSKTTPAALPLCAVPFAIDVGVPRPPRVVLSSHRPACIYA